MPARMIVLFALVLGLLGQAGQVAYAAGVAEAAAPRRGQLYKVTLDGKTSYLYGTIHVGKDGVYPLDAQAAQALLGARALVIELDIRENAAFQQAMTRHGRYAAGDQVQNHVQPATVQKLVPALARAGLSLQSVQQFKPWLIANLLIGTELDARGFKRAQAAEYALLAAAQQQDKAVRQLESADYQLGLFDTLDPRQQEQYLLESLADLDNGTAMKKSLALIEAWNAADIPGIEAAWRNATSGNSIAAEFMQRVLLGKRNPEMAANIERIMQQDRVAFVGVGLLHLVGDDGLPQLLKRRGYRVEQLY
ncbi:conjugal transfer protein TraB [Duganella sp. Leaf126]|uniref:TraB/GumN family protein n=1 Tax=Duganella sp. Leaf126 TaxID=1736266 RepID=UPI0006F9D2FD|nr:TraB/GumN family protein [Duganella sp. Leaf126]KQQ45286.1 conjugal transfer protein TraB [Duganella sp. Leaf126]